VSVVNSAPELEVEILTSGLPVGAGAILPCQATVYDPNEEGLTPTFLWENITQGRAIGTEETLIVPTSTDVSDTLRCTASATDAWEATGSNFDEVTVANEPPRISLLSIADVDDIVTGEQDMVCSATAVDPEGSEVTLTLTWLVNAVAPSDTFSTVAGDDSSTLSGFVTRGDVVSCQASARDTSGGGSVETFDVVVGNAAPAIVELSIIPDRALTNTELTASSTITDPEGDATEVTYSWENARGEIQVGDVCTGGFGLKGESVTLTATAIDASRDESVETTSIRIDNTAPTVSDVLVSGSASVGATVSCTYSYFDDDRDLEDPRLTDIRWYSFDGLVAEELATGQTYEIRSGVREIFCEVAVSDAEDLSDAVASPTVIVTAADADDTTDASEDASEEFVLLDVNTTSPTYGAVINPRDYLGQVSAYYFGHAT
jgi:hypothetical protein